VRRRLAVALAALAALPAAAVLFEPPDAAAHAVVEETEPRRSALDTAPERVSIRFNEGIESQFGALRVFDVGGDEVQVGEPLRPSGAEIAVALPQDLPDGAYTATYRVVSADSHPVAGGFVFTVGDAGGASAAGVADLLGDQSAGPVTDAAFGALRGLSYAAIAILAGGALLLVVAWLPALRGTRPRPSVPADWTAASSAFQARATTAMVVAAAAGLVASVAGIVAQGATVSGSTFWGAIDPDLLRGVLDTRLGEVWKLRFTAFGVVIPLLLWLPPFDARGGRLPVGPWRAATIGAALAFLVVSPALAGHAGADGDSLLLVPLDTLHVAAMSAWIGGIALIVVALPGATRALGGGDRSRLLAAVLARFSTIALVAVAALLLTGVLQSLLYLESVDALWETAFGRAILVKAALFAVLVGFGAYHRRRSLPALREIAARRARPGGAGVALRRALLGELVLFAGVLVATAALVSYSPSATAGGPFSDSIDLGSAQLEITVDPASPGDNEIHVYLFDSRTGAQYDRPREFSLSAAQEELDIGPIELRVRKAGPGHYTVPRAPLAPAGDWTLEAKALISDFEELRGEVDVPIR
jgi:copper transport protein